MAHDARRPDQKVQRADSALIHSGSLSRTVDAINAAYFSGRPLAAAERGQAARWIAARQGLPGAYGGTFAGFPAERANGIVLFTGERVAFASARHILGEESSRALRLLQVRDRDVARALDAADEGLTRCLARAAQDPSKRNPGVFCCGKCTVGFWRNVLAGGLDRREERLRRGVLHLRELRDGDHGWRTFPFWYTVLALNEIGSDDARRELKYAAPALERAASRAVPSAVYARRRQELAARALNTL
jgi:hypothetical protein